MKNLAYCSSRGNGQQLVLLLELKKGRFRFMVRKKLLRSAAVQTAGYRSMYFCISAIPATSATENSPNYCCCDWNGVVSDRRLSRSAYSEFPYVEALQRLPVGCNQSVRVGVELKFINSERQHMTCQLMVSLSGNRLS